MVTYDHWIMRTSSRVLALRDRPLCQQPSQGCERPAVHGRAGSARCTGIRVSRHMEGGPTGGLSCAAPALRNARLQITGRGSGVLKLALRTWELLWLPGACPRFFSIHRESVAREGCSFANVVVAMGSSSG